MHVLLLSRSFPHHRAGGMEWHVQDIAKGLMASGHQVSVLTTPLPEVPALEALEVNGTILTAGRDAASYGLPFFADCWRLRPRVAELAPDVIHAQGYAGLPAEYFFSKVAPVVTTVHGTLWSETPLRRGSTDPATVSLHWKYKHRYAFAPLWRAFLRRARWIVVDSRFTARELKRDGRLRRKPLMVPLGFDLDRFPVGDRDAARQGFEVGDGDILLASVGRLEKVKRPEWILKAFLKLAPDDPRLRLVLAGEGPELSHLKQLVAASPYGDRALFPGRLPAGKITSLYQAADLFLNADHGAPAFGLTNAEALVMGTPVLATDAGAHREVVTKEDSCCGLVKCGDFDGWLDRLLKVLERLPEADQLRQDRAGFNRQRFNRANMIKKLEKIYDRMAQSV